METAGHAVLRLPVLGWLVRDAIYGLPDAKYYFFANCALALAACALRTASWRAAICACVSELEFC